MATYIGATPAGGHLNSSHGRDCAKIPLRIICPTRRNLKNCVPPYGHKTTKNIQLLIFKWSRNLDKTNNPIPLRHRPRGIQLPTVDSEEMINKLLLITYAVMRIVMRGRASFQEFLFSCAPVNKRTSSKLELMFGRDPI